MKNLILFYFLMATLLLGGSVLANQQQGMHTITDQQPMQQRRGPTRQISTGESLYDKLNEKICLDERMQTKLKENPSYVEKIVFYKCACIKFLSGEFAEGLPSKEEFDCTENQDYYLNYINI